MRGTWVLAEFASPSELLAGLRRARELGFTDVDTHSPFPVHGTSEALGLRRSWVPSLALAGGLTGAIGAWVMQWWMNGVNYPLNVGNRPPYRTPAFVPVTFESAVLLSALAIFFGLLLLSRLPQPYHPVFELEEFRSASTHAYWLSVRLADVARRGELEQRLQELGATRVHAVGEGT